MKKLFFLIAVLLCVFALIGNCVWAQPGTQPLNQSDWQKVNFSDCFTLSLPPGFYAQEEFATDALSWDIKGGDFPVKMPTDLNRYNIENKKIGGKTAQLAIVKPNKFGVNTGVRFEKVCGNRILRMFTWTMVQEYKDTALAIIKSIKFK